MKRISRELDLALEYTFWLMPAEPFKAALQTTVGKLADEFAAPKFDAHVTLYHGLSSVEEARQAAAKIAARSLQMALELAGFEQSADFSKTFYIQFHPAAQVNELCEMFRDEMKAPGGYILNPHLSLLYKTMPEPLRQELCARQIVADGVYIFDAIQAIEFDAPWSGQYRSLGEYALRHR